MGRRNNRKKNKGKSPAKGKSKKELAKVSDRSVTAVLTSEHGNRDVKFGAFSLSAFGNVLINDTEIEMTVGRRYGLIGRNGSGKSQFLKCLAQREVPIPDFIDIFYLEHECPPEDISPMDKVIKHAEDEVKRLEDEAEKLCEEDPNSDLVQDIYERIDDLDEGSFKSRAGKILKGLGFTDKLLAKNTCDLSGGWRMRVSLAMALFIQPSLLLLDEPTNHLDLEACVWLEQYLAGYKQCLILISHSQDFMNGVCTNIIHITHQKELKYYSGNYDTFVKTKKENEVNQLKRYKKEQDDIAHLKHFIATCGTYSNLVKQAKSKQKILDKMEAAGLTEKPHDGFDFKFRFTNVTELPPPVLAFNNLAFSYSGKKEDYLYSNVNLGIDMDSCVALVGPNGAGKSTLMKLMTGELTATEGEIKRHCSLRMGKYHQHSVDQLDMKMSPLEFLPTQFRNMKKEVQEWRAVLGQFGVDGTMQKTVMGKLSDGQKSRIVFCMLALESPHIVMLDEPTNHLDMESIDSLAEAINQFNGGTFLISHDFRLIDQVAKEIWICEGGRVFRYKGGIRKYKAQLIKNASKHM